MLRTLGARHMRQPLLRGATAAHTGIYNGVRAQLRRLQTVASFDAHEALKDEDISLRDIFDLPTKTTMGSRWFHTAGQPTGLLMESRFVSPKTFRSAGEQAVAEAEALLQKVLTAQSFSEKRNVVKCLDQLSDALCRVMDVAELVRQAHPDSHWQEAADEVYAFMFEYMNGLNTHVGLYRKLVEIMDDAQISATFSAVEHEVALSFRRDFERSGIHLTKSDHERFVALSSDIQELSREFFRRQSVPRENSTVKMPFDQLRTLPSQVAMGILQSSRTSKGKDGTTMIELPVDDYTAHYVLRDCSEEKVREAVYRQWQHGDEQAVGALEALLERRLALSHTVGF
ncbi:Mitochondrial intermediate peptidase, partial [Linderina pennispora]